MSDKTKAEEDAVLEALRQSEERKMTPRAKARAIISAIDLHRLKKEKS